MCGFAYAPRHQNPHTEIVCFLSLARSSGGTSDPVVSLSAFAYLFSEIVQYHQNRVDSISELERRLETTGYAVGLRVLELLACRSRDARREVKLMNVLQFISTTVWKALFSKPADSLERSIDHADEFMIVDYAPVTRYVLCTVLLGGGAR